jgi:hypothetical protein
MVKGRERDWSVTRSEQSWSCSGDKETATARTAALYEKKDKDGILKSLLFSDFMHTQCWSSFEGSRGVGGGSGGHG